MDGKTQNVKRICSASGLAALLAAGIVLIVAGTGELKAGSFFASWRERHANCGPACAPGHDSFAEETAGTWYWLRSPEEEKRLIASLYNRYCIRCHGVDGRGVWDIPDVPNFTNAGWQAHRNDGQLARSILEGRGAVMPPFRGTLSLEECWAMARYLRTFIPGTEVSRPDFGSPNKPAAAKTPPRGASRP
jgi:hypothetical protein